MTELSEERQRLASILRSLRIDAALSTTELARRLNWSQSKVSKTERGETLPPPEDVERWAQLTKASREVRDELSWLATATTADAVEWKRAMAPGRRRWQQEIHRLEANASVVRVFSPDVVVGLAQIRPYAEMMFRMGSDVDPDESLDEIVSARLDRQETLNNSGRRFEFVMDETALRRRIIPAPDMRVQIERLIHLSSQANIDIGVIKFDATDLTHQYLGFAIIGDPTLDAESIVLAETPTKGLRIRATEEINEYVKHFNALRATATSGDDLRAFLQEVIGSIDG
ncbi:helix-turn-helix domain-containing protein [Lentzea sp. NPDC051213]|uniref:helix-turn-helix domain-containing protein n=1 Tax=Lentzea sp. NPDC051213 TaxID=3364126 RepID=UPI0037B57220